MPLWSRVFGSCQIYRLLQVVTSKDHRPDPPETCEAPIRENSVCGLKGLLDSQPRSRLKQAMQKFAKRATKNLSKPFKSSCNRIPANQKVVLEDASTTVVQNIEMEGASSSQKLDSSNNNKHPTTSEILSDSVNQGLSGEPASQVAPSRKEEGFDPQLVDAELQGACDNTQRMRLLGKHATSMASTASNVPVDLAAAEDFETTYLQPLKIINGVLEKIADVWAILVYWTRTNQVIQMHPYTKMALGVLSAASKIIVAQAERDKSIKSLLEQLAEVYHFMTLDDSLSKIESMCGVISKIAQQTLECACFIREYSEMKSFWKRISKNVIAETDDIITQYNDALDGLMQQFCDRTDRDIAIFVQFAGETLDLNGMTYAAGVGLNTMKQCLPGTRKEILSQITDWINDSGDAAKHVMWLSGPAGKGKSAIVHTIANWFEETGGLGSCYCFYCHREADCRHEKIFSTIARDLADHDPGMKRVLANAVKNMTSLKNTTDIVQQWCKLLMETLKKFPGSSVGPVLIVIDVLDESGRVETWQDLLRILAGKLQNTGLPQITELPSNFRILVTSHSLPNIKKGFEGAGHILRLSMDDIRPEAAECDIHAFVSEQLKELLEFQDDHLATLAANSNRLFEWVCLTCKYIKEPEFGSSSMDRFNAVMNRNPGEWKNLLYDMYGFILTEMMPKDKNTPAHKQAMAKFCSVMGQILATTEPLPLVSLNAMQHHFPEDHNHYEVELVIKHMGSLLSGTTNSYTPIRPFIGDFFVERTKGQQCNLAFASLRVMKDGLGFNICDLKLLYLPNSQVTGLSERVKTSIPPHLSFSCRYWATHVQTTDFDDELTKEIRSLFNEKRLMFWIEALGLLDAISDTITMLPLVAKWLKGHSGYEDVQSATMDVQRFMQVFGRMILHSTPHLYLSALPFSLVNCTIATKFMARFSNVLLLRSGETGASD
ncbi:uncharacterized protein F5891DRAFT_1215023 [Suillus fuscotomentosus]|uniref:Nephrocystin 3-like N-terminal domain-containing protein n=1 Tax=Suillus fuscotomentosus TaxID=1912939 RepID=A0AAD4HPD0_9AGAM|nr:uncharacterized protein F5891DRAFT_1215023 [Suillus fuscotomentosus]KAG1902624.1 hypothetical protein F5891DRAFT_1215023 [Suillus fuscotomentosus]